MAEHRDPSTETTAEDDAFLAGASQLGTALRNPFAIGMLAVAAAALLFRLGVSAGEAIYGAFDGDGLMAAAFGGTLVAVLVTIIAVGVWLDRRQSTRDAQTAPLSDGQRARLASYLEPASPLVRWHQPLTVVVFIALAVPGTWLLDAPWDGLWVIAVLVANPLGRWLRSQGHVLTTRDLGFPVPGLSPWPSIAMAALAAATGMAIAVLLWADALGTTLAITLTGIVVVAVILGGELVTRRHERRHISGLLDERSG